MEAEKLQVSMEEWHRRIPDYRIKEGETPRYSPAIREVQHLPLVWDRQADGYESGDVG